MNPSILITPNAVEEGKLFSIIPTDGAGDLDVVRATTATYVGTDGLIQTALANVPRLDYSNGSCPSILVEPQRTNSIRNSTMQGAVVGTPGTLPTNWAQGGGGSSSTTRTVIGTGIENGLTYIDIRYQGTVGGQLRLIEESGTTQPATVGTSITISYYIKLVSGTAPQVQLVISNRDSSNTYISDNSSSYINLTNSLTRYTSSATISQIGTAFAQPLIQWVFPGDTYDFTVRIAAPQMELGAYPTSYIPTTSTTVTRNVDVISKTGISDLINSEEGCFYSELKPLMPVTALSCGYSLSNGTNGELIFMSFTPVTNRLTLSVVNSNGVAFSANIEGVDFLIYNKIAINWKQSEFKVFINSSLVYSNLSFNTFTENSLSQLRLARGDNQRKFEGNLKSVLVFPTQLTDEKCIALTTL